MREGVNERRRNESRVVSDISYGGGFVAPSGSTPVRKRLLREAAAMIDRGQSMNDAVYAIYDEYIGKPWRTADAETLIRNTETIEKGIRRKLSKHSANVG